MVVRFLQDHSGRPPAGPPFSEWLKAQHVSAGYAISIHPGIEPAPTTARVMAAVDRKTPATLREARLRDPAAPVFQSNDLARIVSKALARGDFEAADAPADLALEVHPGAPVFVAYKSHALEGRGDVAKAAETAATCAGLQAGNDWRATAAINQCKARLANSPPRQRGAASLAIRGCLSPSRPRLRPRVWATARPTGASR